jgi:predicted transcriptional regulator
MHTNPEGAELARKDQVKEFIAEHPGTHLREICRKLSIAMGVAQYHTERLEKERVIVSRRRGLYRRYYANLVFAEKDIDILDVLSQETEREILLFLTQKPGSSQKDISDFAKLSLPTVNWHIKRLIASGLIETRLGKDSSHLSYSIIVDKRTILQLLKNYHPAVWERWADQIADVWTDFSFNRSSEEEKEKLDFKY